jgi:hypothetical protein
MHIEDTRGVTGHRIAWARHLREERPLRQSSKLLSYVVLVILVASSTGCVTPAVTFKAAGHFEDSDELVDGYTQIGSGGTGTIMLVNRTTGALYGTGAGELSAREDQCGSNRQGLCPVR